VNSTIQEFNVDSKAEYSALSVYLCLNVNSLFCFRERTVCDVASVIWHTARLSGAKITWNRTWAR